MTAYLTAEATAQGLSTCILGWLDDEKIRNLCGTEHPTRLVITLGYAAEGDKLREKKRKDLEEIAKTKLPDVNANDLEAAKKIVAGTARSMGVEVER